jgi:RND family efflux transporter MFP subunit
MLYLKFLPSPNYIHSLKPLPLLAVFLLAGCIAQSSEPVPAGPAYHHKVDTVIAEAQDRYQIPRRYTGIVTARQTAAVGFERAGKLINIAVDEGDRVTNGTLLAELDTELLQRERDEIVAQRKETAARLDLVEQNLKRINALVNKGHASVQQQDELISERKALAAALERLAAALAVNRTQLEKSRLTAPFDAIVSHRFADTGVVIASGTPVLRLLQQGAMEARIGLPAASVSLVDINEPVELQADGAPLTGRVLSIGSEVDVNTRTVPVRIALPADAGVVDGALIDLLLQEQIKHSGFWLPATSVTDGLRGLWNVYTLQATETPDLYRIETRDVQIDHADSNRVFVSGALNDGEAVIKAGLQRLVPGQIVRYEQAVAQR